MSIYDEARAVAEWWSLLRSDTHFDWSSILETYDLGFPFAWGLIHGHILTLGDDGERQISYTFTDLLSYFEKVDGEWVINSAYVSSTLDTDYPGDDD